MSEREAAGALANRIMDRLYLDQADDIVVLARHLLRTLESEARLRTIIAQKDRALREAVRMLNPPIER